MEQIANLPEQLRHHWERFQDCFITRTRDTSEYAYEYLRGQLTMDTNRNYAGIARTLAGADGQGLQHFMSNAPWSGDNVYRHIQEDIRATPPLAQGSYLILDESGDEKAGQKNAGAARQYNGRKGKVDVCQVAVVLGYAHWRCGPWPIWAMVDSALFLPQAWFGPDCAVLRQKLGIPPERSFETKLELGLKMILRAQQQGLPFTAVACDALYGRDGQFRASLAQAGITYYASVPVNTQVYLAFPHIGVPQKPALTSRGRPPSRLQVLNSVTSLPVAQVAQAADTVWQRLCIRHQERGVLEDDFAVRRVWTWIPDEAEARAEWLILRRERNGDCTYTLSNAAGDTPLPSLAEGSCARYFVERVIQDAKQEQGWDEFQAQKYLGWQHHTALTACALWFIAQTKLAWAADCARDPQLALQLEVIVLPALSTANVRLMLKAVLPLPQLSLEEARAQVVQHLVRRSRSTASRLRHSRH